MFTEFIEEHPTGTITRAQTTYLELQTEKGSFRIEFKEKTEAKLKPGRGGALAYFTHHPLLLIHNEDTATVYIHSKPIDPQALREEIHQSISALYQGWRDWRSHFFGWHYEGAESLLVQNLAQGSGMILDRAPASVAKLLLAACEKYGAATSVFGSAEPDPTTPVVFSLFFIGSYYVIAKGFRASAL
ncbi:hypothetical protein [Hymenobacter sp. DG25A]|uniref:hypothetical protein n=1 Tax=Hymenobacter sp. DG25A TaxID=1385663 RepID=UPI0006BC7C83|nr:hypothetical protein [Hymenobacter sp. DG25A]ALD21320.1 hypothetical protein AM218_08940 [Hymenobacter sp. DG25A]